MSNIFLDTFVYIEATKDKEFEYNLIKYANENYVFISQLVLIELMRTSYDIDKRINLLSRINSKFLLINPTSLIDLEFVCFFTNTKMDILSLECSKHLNAQEWESLYIKASNYKVEDLRNYHAFGKITRNFCRYRNSKLTIGEFLDGTVIKNNTNFAYYQKNFKNQIEDRFDIKRYEDFQDIEVIKIKNRTLEEEQIFIRDTIKKFNLQYEKVKKLKTINFLKRVNFLQAAERSLSSFDMQNSNLLDKVKWENYNICPGYYLYETTKESVELSGRKALTSDEFDLLNLVYAPYMNIYVADKDVSSKIKEEHIMSLKDFKKRVT